MYTLCCAVLCCAVLCCAVLCCAVLCCAVLCCAVLCCAVLCCAVLCCAVICCAVSCMACCMLPTAKQVDLDFAATEHKLVAQMYRAKSKRSCWSLQTRTGELYSISSWKSFRRLTEATKASMCRCALYCYIKHAECQVVSEACRYDQICLRKQTIDLLAWSGWYSCHMYNGSSPTHS